MKETFEVYYGSVFFCKGSKLHREYGPYEVWKNGSVLFRKEDKYHRDCGPSKVWCNGTVYFFKGGKSHRDCGSVQISGSGEKEFSNHTPESVIPLLLLEWEKKYEKDF